MTNNTPLLLSTSEKAYSGKKTSQNVVIHTDWCRWWSRRAEHRCHVWIDRKCPSPQHQSKDYRFCFCCRIKKSRWAGIVSCEWESNLLPQGESRKSYFPGWWRNHISNLHDNNCIPKAKPALHKEGCRRWLCQMRWKRNFLDQPSVAWTRHANQFHKSVMLPTEDCDWWHNARSGKPTSHLKIKLDDVMHESVKTHTHPMLRRQSQCHCSASLAWTEP